MNDGEFVKKLVGRLFWCQPYSSYDRKEHRREGGLRGEQAFSRLVEVNPILDEHNRTAELAVQLLCSTLGKKIF
ncbi:MAG TPA: hypothetical protein VMD97_13495 [Candidatus Aquilonibacter sp.]|nr:hypothetical protein [Candidatus Aquilonibacter sp.]